MKIIIVLCSLLLTLNVACASTIPLSAVPPIGSVSGGWATIGATTISGGAATIEMEARMAGVVARIPAVATLGADAAKVGLAAIRLNPVGLATSAILQYLIQVGIQKCLDGTWCVPAVNSVDPVDAGMYWTSQSLYPQSFDSPMAACNAWGQVAGYGAATGMFDMSAGTYGCAYAGGGRSNLGVYSTGVCRTGYILSGSSCMVDPNGKKLPATDADWNKALTYPMPDQVATDLSAAKVPLPVTVTPKVPSLTINLGDPYVDPVTGKRYRDVAVITPNADGKTATLNVVKQEVDPSGNPVIDTTTGSAKAPDKQDDPCTGHETRLGCAEQGDIPQAPDLKEQQINVSITPDGGWGPDNASCPADIPLSFAGRSFSLSWSPICSFASMVRPIVLAMAWLAAALIVVGAGKQGGD